jgi:hypothetical protein
MTNWKQVLVCHDWRLVDNFEIALILYLIHLIEVDNIYVFIQGASRFILLAYSTVPTIALNRRFCYILEIIDSFLDLYWRRIYLCTSILAL